AEATREIRARGYRRARTDRASGPDDPDPCGVRQLVRTRRERRASSTPTPTLAPPIATSSATSVPVNGNVAALVSCAPWTCVPCTCVGGVWLAGATSGGLGGFGYAPATLRG